jgi:hypothetical protein
MPHSRCVTPPCLIVSPSVTVWAAAAQPNRQPRNLQKSGLSLAQPTPNGGIVLLHTTRMGELAGAGRVAKGEPVRKILVVVAAACTFACAPAPETIQAAYVSEVPYRSWSCDQLGEENIRLNEALATASVAQNSARTNDTVGILLIGLPVGSMSGQSIAPQIALYKGQMEAVRRASIRNSCPEMTRILPAGAPAPGRPTVSPGVQPQAAPPPALEKPISEAPGAARRL